MQPCPCQIKPSLTTTSNMPAYKECCQPYHDDSHKAYGITANSAEQLMRTRYSAFVLVKPDYLVSTTLPAQQGLLDIKAIEAWAKETDWAGLEIVTHTPEIGQRHAQVAFKAYFNTANNTSAEMQAHHERSTFVKVTDKASNHTPANHKDERWYFLDPTVAMSVTQKQPCICGSGEKFKRCCGVYI